MPERRIPCSATRLQGRTSSTVIAVATVLFATVVGGAAAFAWRAGFALPVGFVLGVVGAGVITRRRELARPGGEVRLRADGIDVERGGEVVRVEIGEVKGAYPTDGDAAVLELADGSILTCAFRSGDEAAEVLAHMGAGDDARAIEVPLRGVIGTFTRCFGAFMLVELVSPLLTIWLVPRWWFAVSTLLAVLACVVVGRRTPRLVVGNDGLRVRELLGTRFVRYADVRDVSRVFFDGSERHQSYPGIRVELAGDVLVLPFIGREDAQVAGVLARIRRSLDDFGRSDPGGLDLLDRGQRSVREWRDDLRSLANGAGTYRSRALDEGELARLLQSPAAPIARRVAAALMLGGSSDVRVRIALAAEASAEPAVREVLDATAREDLEELERALERVTSAGR